MPKTQARFSTEPVLVPVQVLVPEGVNSDITKDVVEFQFIWGGLPLRSQPTDSGWTAGYWLRDVGGILAAVNVGPTGSIALAPGRYAVCVRVHDTTTPAAPVDVLTIT